MDMSVSLPYQLRRQSYPVSTSFLTSCVPDRMTLSCKVDSMISSAGLITCKLSESWSEASSKNLIPIADRPLNMMHGYEALDK
jgi:hypothetical protein